MLGSLLHAETHRDAIHIAIAPVKATEKLTPGQPIEFVANSVTDVKAAVDSSGIGIVDPFLTAMVFPDQQFYMLLHPNTITGLRHEWTHPAFDDHGRESAVARLRERRR